MRQAKSEAETWKRMVLRSMPAPAWLSEDAPQGDVVLSSRCRLLRNLAGHRFPHRADRPELETVVREVLDAAAAEHLNVEALRGLTQAERDYLVGCRLVSPDFPWDQHGRALLLDPPRSLSMMINEEDHLRLQGLTAGWSIESSSLLVESAHERLKKHLSFAHSPRFGFLAASPFNAGEGSRLSAMFHLIGLAQGKRLPTVLKALSARGIAARGLFGESSRAIGAFVQVSVLSGPRSDFVGACEYLMREERESRAHISRDELHSKAMQALNFAVSSRTIGLADALRVLAWLRWAVSSEIEGFVANVRQVDSALTTIEIRSGADEATLARHRADSLRDLFEELRS